MCHASCQRQNLTKSSPVINFVMKVFPGWTVAGLMEAQRPQAAPTRPHSRRRSWSALKSWWLAPDLALLLKRSPCHQLQLFSGLTRLFPTSAFTFYSPQSCNPCNARDTDCFYSNTGHGGTCILEREEENFFFNRETKGQEPQ